MGSISIGDEEVKIRYSVMLPACSLYNAYSNALVATGEGSTALYLHPSVYNMRQNAHTEAIGGIAGSRAALICLFSGFFVVPCCF